jgi:hypothetical protein
MPHQHLASLYSPPSQLLWQHLIWFSPGFLKPLIMVNHHFSFDNICMALIGYA